MNRSGHSLAQFCNSPPFAFMSGGYQKLTYFNCLRTVFFQQFRNLVKPLDVQDHIKSSTISIRMGA